MSRDGITGLVALVTSLVLFALTLDLKQSPMVPIGPGFYPRIVLGVTAVLAAALLLFDLSARKKPATKATRYGLVLGVFAIFGLYVGVLPYLGFRVATLVFVAGLQSTIEPPKGARGWLVVAVTAVVTPVAAYYLFETQLNVLLPRGRWTGF
jgi:putative tricarboxylic transport membrane protein